MLVGGGVQVKTVAKGSAKAARIGLLLTRQVSKAERTSHALQQQST